MVGYCAFTFTLTELLGDGAGLRFLLIIFIHMIVGEYDRLHAGVLVDNLFI